MKIYIETERLLIREITEADVQGFYELDSDPEVHKYLGNNPVKSMAECLDVIRYVRKQYQDNGIGRWAVEDKLTKEFVGWTGLKYEWNDRQNVNYYDLGYRLKRKFWGKGIATETAVASLKYGFTKMNLEEIFAAAHTENIASNKILTKIGLKCIDTFDYHGAQHNWYWLEKSEWERNELASNPSG